MLKDSVFLKDEAETERFGRLLALATSDLPVSAKSAESQPEATGGGMIYLSGGLGAGKTTLTRGLMRAYGYSGAVKSPTYTLVEPYEFSRYNIYHFDLYRLSDPDEVEFLGVTDYFESQNLCLVEWPQNGGSLLPKADLLISLAIEEQGRQLSWQAVSSRGQEIAERLLEFSRIL
ncbi:MAG: tRNA (adenosine(37)-N6)-threonylcarbamoyltransferase complex ATPase subunit type 1 TsaE [Gammaproteobacteria bacterium]|nr:tRNA (adenosine(37)-N6)-threonylcarbamoyltransferase complex ATPase subunit type 1 TsaE [Gammaproteobacteria bacterium]